MEDDGFNRVLVRCSSAVKDGYGTLYIKDVTEMFREQIKTSRNRDIMFQYERRNALSSAFFRSNIMDYICSY